MHTEREIQTSKDAQGHTYFQRSNQINSEIPFILPIMLQNPGEGLGELTGTLLRGVRVRQNVSGELSHVY